MSGRGRSCMDEFNHELCKFCLLGAFFLQGSAQWPENLHVNSRSALRSALSCMCSTNLALFVGNWACVQALLFGLSTPTGSMTVTKWHKVLLQSDLLLILGGFLDMNALDGLESCTHVLQMNTKIQVSWFVWFCRVFWVKWTANSFQIWS